MGIISNDNRQKAILPFQKKIILILFGIIFSIALLEIGLRLGGFIFSLLHESRNIAEIHKKGTYRIMCLGESTTAIGGEDSYPAQLEEILNQSNTGIKFSAINRGLIAVNTTGIISHLEENLNKYQPDMVTVMMGVNDNYIKYYEDIPDVDSFLFRNFRVYRLMRMLWISVIKKIRGDYTDRYNIPGLKESYDDQLNLGEKEKALKEAIELNPRNIKAYMELGICYRKQGKHIESQEAYKKIIELDPKNDKAYVQLGFCYIDQGKDAEAEETLRKAVELNPRNNNAYLELGRFYRDKNRYQESAGAFRKAIELKSQSDFGYLNLGLCCTYLGEYGEAEEAFKKAIKLNPRNDRVYGGLAVLYKEMGNYRIAKECHQKADNLRTEYYNPITRYNYRRLKEILDSKGIKMVSIQYPVRSIMPLKKMFKDSNGIIFVDNEKIFKEALKNASFKEYFMDMFAGDFGHCTPKGNKLLAENVANAILKERFNVKVPVKRMKCKSQGKVLCLRESE